MNCPNCGGSTWDTYTGANAFHTGGISILCVGSIALSPSRSRTAWFG